MSDWSVDRMLALAHRHADLEAKRELEPLMATLVTEPVYEFHPLGRKMCGGATTRRYYEQFFADFMEKIVDYELLDEWCNERSAAQEYDITLNVDGRTETHRVVGILFAEPEPRGAGLLGGERIYASEATVRLFAGAMFDELEDL